MNQPSSPAHSSLSIPSCETTKPNRVIGYIDGYNLYYGMKEDGQQEHLWLDLNAMMQALLLPSQELVHTKYFTSRTNYPQDSVRRQTTYLEAIGTLPKMTIVEGRYEGEPFHCTKCGHPAIKHSEKMTDVNIAVTMVNDASDNLFDTAILVTGDSDQVPTIELIHRLWSPSKRVICAFPPRRKSKHLQSVAKGTVHISDVIIRRSQLPDLIQKPGTFPLARPAHWTKAAPAAAEARNS